MNADAKVSTRYSQVGEFGGLELYPNSEHAKQALHYLAQSYHAVADYGHAAEHYEPFAENDEDSIKRFGKHHEQTTKMVQQYRQS